MLCCSEFLSRRLLVALSRVVVFLDCVHLVTEQPLHILVITLVLRRDESLDSVLLLSHRFKLLLLDALVVPDLSMFQLMFFKVRCLQSSQVLLLAHGMLINPLLNILRPRDLTEALLASVSLELLFLGVFGTDLSLQVVLEIPCFPDVFHLFTFVVVIETSDIFLNDGAPKFIVLCFKHLTLFGVIAVTFGCFQVPRSCQSTCVHE